MEISLRSEIGPSRTDQEVLSYGFRDYLNRIDWQVELAV